MAALTTMENIYEALRESHELQRKLCRQLTRINAGSSRALDIFRTLRIELAAHAAAEERYFYAPILMDDRGLDSSRHALAERHDIDECVEDLGKAREHSVNWVGAPRSSHTKCITTLGRRSIGSSRSQERFF